MLAKEHLKNILVFMERAQSSGKEAIAWAQTYAAVEKQLNAPVVPVAPTGDAP